MSMGNNIAKGHCYGLKGLNLLNQLKFCKNTSLLCHLIPADFRGAKEEQEGLYMMQRRRQKHSRESLVLWPNNGEEFAMDDVKRALLGDNEAAKRLTEAWLMIVSGTSAQWKMQPKGNRVQNG